MTPALVPVEWEVRADPDGFIVGHVARVNRQHIGEVDAGGLGWRATLSAHSAEVPNDLRAAFHVRDRTFPHNPDGLRDAAQWLVDTWTARQSLLRELLDGLRSLDRTAHPMDLKEQQ